MTAPEWRSFRELMDEIENMPNRAPICGRGDALTLDVEGFMADCEGGNFGTNGRFRMSGSSHELLRKAAVKWLSGRRRCAVVVSELVTAAGETPDAIGWHGGSSILVECKASRSDFHANKDKPHERSGRAVGRLRFFLCPESTITAEDISGDWGLLWLILRGPWRFGYDYMPERSTARRMMEILKGESAKKKRVYVLIGNEPFADCLHRASEVLDWGGEPYCQPYLLKTTLDRNDYVIKHDWTYDKLTHFTRYFNRFLWKYTPMSEYKCGNKRPFEVLA